MACSTSTFSISTSTVGDSFEWVTFPGGELQGQRPSALCPRCRHLLQSGALRSNVNRPLCFQCYRAELDRQRKLAEAGGLDTASPERFQFVLPLEPLDSVRLQMLKAERNAARAEPGARDFSGRRRRAQIAARQALGRVALGLAARRAILGATAMPLPESWLPFVVSR
jgi:hypothetical protein